MMLQHTPIEHYIYFDYTPLSPNFNVEAQRREATKVVQHFLH